MKVAVVILNWNGKKFLEKFLPSVISFNPSYSEIIVADNASTDDSIDFLKRNYPQIKIIQNVTNGGFAKGYNEALSNLEAEYYVLLNSDVEVTAGWIAPVINMMDADRSIAACQPKIKAYDNKKFFEYAGAAGGYLDKYGYPFCRGRILDHTEEDLGQYDDSREIFWATGACLFVRSECFHLVKGFDDDFFAHMEEIDLCWRLKNRGYKIMYCAESTVYHVGGGTLNKTSPKKTYLNFRNNLIMLYKNLTGSELIWVILIRFFLDAISAWKSLVSGKSSYFFAVAKAHFGFFSWLLFYRSKSLFATHRTGKIYGKYNGNIVLEHFLKGKNRFSEIIPTKK